MTALTGVVRPELPDTYWAWVAGIVDGEGCYMVRTAKRNRPIAHPTARGDVSVRATLHVVNTDVPMLERLALSGGGVKPQKRPSRPLWSPTFVWRVGAPWIREFGPRMLPYAVTKRAHLEMLVEALASDGLVRDNLERVAPTLKLMNRRGA